MKTTVIYHSADYDGIFCREIAKRFLPDALLIGWNFGEPKIYVPDGNIYVLDLSPECLELPPGYPDRLSWIDHHKSSIEKWDKNLKGYRIDGVAACRLAWQWFTKAALPEKQAYINRIVTEPLAVRLAGEYDIWDKRDPNAELFQHGLRSKELTEVDWTHLLGEDPKDNKLILNLLAAGESLQYAKRKQDKNLVERNSFKLNWEGLNFLVLNTTGYNSLTYAALDKPETGHDALLGFNFNGKLWTISLYHANHRKDLDLSTIAVKYGGGGHKGACGFTVRGLPFTLPS